MGFEVANTTTNAPFDRTGVDVNGPGVKLINLVVHDHSGNGIGAWIPAPDAEVYGCIVYNNGWHGSSDAPPSYGHGIYSQNQTGSKLFADNIVFNQFGAGIHAYGSDVAFLNNYDLEGNVSFNNGSPLGRGNPDILLGGHVGMNNIRVNNNMTYQTSGGTSVWLGWTSTQNNDLVAQNNYFAGQIQVVNWNSVVFRNNRLQHANKMELLVPTATVPVYDWDNNGYVLTHVNDVWGGPFGTTIAGVSTNYSSLAAFQTATGGLDAHSTLSQPSSGTPSGNLAFVRPNVYEPGRANIIIYNWDQAATVSVDVSSVLAVGTRFEVRNVQDFLGTPVLTGTYAGGSLQLPMAGLQPPRPIGVPLDPLVGSPVTGPEFNVFVLRTLP